MIFAVSTARRISARRLVRGIEESPDLRRCQDLHLLLLAPRPLRVLAGLASR